MKQFGRSLMNKQNCYIVYWVERATDEQGSSTFLATSRADAEAKFKQYNPDCRITNIKQGTRDQADWEDGFEQ